MAFMTIVAARLGYPLVSDTVQVVPGPLVVESGALIDLTGPAFDHAGDYVIFEYGSLSPASELPLTTLTTYVAPSGFEVTAAVIDYTLRRVTVTLGAV